jgi:tetratricopeptide (TPR) repeat protein
LSHAGKSVEGRRYQLEAEVLARRVGHTWSVAYIIARDASAYLSEGDLERARARSEEAVELVRPSGDRRLHGLPAFLTLGLVYLAQDDFEAAREQFRTVLATDWIPVPSRLAIEGLAVLAARTERFIRALKLGGAASELLGSFARRGLPQHEMQHWIDVARRHVDPQGAEAAWRAGRAMSARELIDYALTDEDETTAANDVSVSQLTP